MAELENVTTMPGEDRLTKRNLWGYSMGGIGRDMVYQLVNTYLLTFILFTKGLDTTQFALISVIIICCRIFDGANDPFMGSLIEITRTKLGKFKPWILTGVFTNVAVIMALFWVPLRGNDYVIFFIFGYLMWGITFTMNDISYWGMLPSLTSNETDRNNLSTLANLGAGIGAAIAVVAIPFFTAGKFTIGGDTITAYGYISAIVCALFIGCQVMTSCVVKEKPLPPVAMKDNGDKRSLKDMFAVIFHNDQLKAITLTMILYNIGSAIMMGLCTYFIYFRFGYEGFLVTVFTVLSGISAAVMVFYPIMSKKFTRRQIAMIAMTMIVIGYSLLLILGLTTGAFAGSKTSIVSFVILALCGSFASFGQSIFYMVQTISVANTVEYNEYKTGVRDEGIIFACRPFMAKMGSAITQGIITIVLISLKINETTKAISDQEFFANQGTITEEAKLANIGNILSGVAPDVPQWLIACMTVLPMLLLVGSFLVFFKFYKIDEKYYAEITTAIAERNAAGAVCSAEDSEATDEDVAPVDVEESEQAECETEETGVSDDAIISEDELVSEDEDK